MRLIYPLKIKKKFFLLEFNLYYTYKKTLSKLGKDLDLAKLSKHLNLVSSERNLQTEEITFFSSF